MEKRGRSDSPWAPGGGFRANVHPSRPASGTLRCPAGSSASPGPAAAARPAPCVLERWREASSTLWDAQSLGVRTMGSAPCTHGPGHLPGVSSYSGKGDTWVWLHLWISESECICQDSACRSLHSRGTHLRAPLPM